MPERSLTNAMSVPSGENVGDECVPENRVTSSAASSCGTGAASCGIGSLNQAIAKAITQNLDNLLRPDYQAQLEPKIRMALQEAVSMATDMVFWCALVAAVACLVCCLLLPRGDK